MTTPIIDSALPDPSAPAPAVAGFHLLDVPVAWTDRHGRLLGANAAFEAAVGLDAAACAGRPLVVLLGLLPAHATDDPTAAQALADRLDHDQDFAAQPLRGRLADGRPLCGLLGQRRADGLRVISLQLASPPAVPPVGAPAAADAQPARHPDLLAVAQQLGRFGVWQHDLRSGESRWDAQVWQFFAMPPRDGGLDFDIVMQAVHPQDREQAVRGYLGSLKQVGSHGVRFRLGGADGQYRHVRSIWQVRPGADSQPAQVLGILLDDTETWRLAKSFDDTSAQLNLAVTLADVAIWQHDLASGQVHGNDRGWALLGLPPQPLGLPASALATLLHPDDLPALRQQIVALQGRLPATADGTPEGPIDLGARCRHADGRWRYLLTRRVAQRNALGELLGHVGVALDLTERHEQQQRALELAQRLEMATAAAGVGVWDLQMGKPPRLYWDEQMRALHGLPADVPAPPLDDYIASLVHPDDRAGVADSMALLLKRREGLLDIDLRIILPNGRVRRLATRSSISGPPGRRHLHGVMLDVTERHATEEQLRQANERAALAARGAGIGTWESDAAASQGWWDAQMFRLRGREPQTEPVTIADMLLWLHPDDRETQQRQLQAALQVDGQTNMEFRVVWPDGSVRWLASRSTPLHDDSGRTVGRIGINWDITDARNAAATRQERLLAQRESQAKSRFLARISHELRTPLNAVLGFSQLLLSETAAGAAPDPATWRRRVEHVQASGEHLLALIDDVLELSSLESGELPLSLQAVALASLVESSLPQVELLAQGQGIDLHLGALAGWALADPVRLRQVLLNLLSNAIKYNRPGGRVTVSTEPDGPWIKLRVQDTGRGLSDEQQTHLFEPFNRLGADRDGIAGTGIGLAIVRASVLHMGGSVAVHSVPGQGSCFELSLQAVAPPVAVAAPPVIGIGIGGISERMPPRPLPPGRRLLYIEDNEVNLMIVSELVRRRQELQFLSAPDGLSGLAMARAEQPVLILLDMQLPDIDGHEVLRRLRADPATAGIRCIALSANAMPEDIRHALAAGFDDYWTKPLDLAAFMRSLDALFGRSGG